MDQSYLLFTFIFKGVHEPFGFRVSGLFTVIAYFFKVFTNASHLFTVIAYFFKVFTNLRFHTGWSINTNKSKQYKEILIELSEMVFVSQRTVELDILTKLPA